MQRVLVLIGVALIAAGLVVGFALPVNSGGYDCGTAFHESSGDVFAQELNNVYAGGDGVSNCDEARSGARTLPVLLLILGGVALVGSPFVRTKESEPART